MRLPYVVLFQRRCTICCEILKRMKQFELFEISSTWCIGETIMELWLTDKFTVIFPQWCMRRRRCWFAGRTTTVGRSFMWWFVFATGWTMMIWLTFPIIRSWLQRWNGSWRGSRHDFFAAFAIIIPRIMKWTLKGENKNVMNHKFSKSWKYLQRQQQQTGTYEMKRPWCICLIHMISQIIVNTNC